MTDYAIRVDEADRPLIVDALRAAADQRKRVATRAAADVAAQRRAGTDVRSVAVKLVDTLAEAATLEQAATDLEAAVAEAPATVDPPPAKTTAPRPRKPRKAAAGGAPPAPAIGTGDADPPPDGDEPADPVDLDAIADAAGLTETIIGEDGTDTDEPVDSAVVDAMALAEATP